MDVISPSISRPVWGDMPPDENVRCYLWDTEGAP